VADRSSLVRQAARLIVGSLGGRNGRGARPRLTSIGADLRGYRNGYRRARLKSAEGEIEFRVPQLADMAEPFRSRFARYRAAARRS
jgi:hypothetical protein